MWVYKYGLRDVEDLVIEFENIAFVILKYYNTII